MSSDFDNHWTPQMPSRPASHANESGSRKAFIAAIPDEWTVSEPSDDYGVDLVVEVFTNDLATGLRFNVQLKSKKKIGNGPKISVRQSTRNYWSALDSPTLVVLWEAGSTNLWWEWAHLIDTYGGKTGAKSVTVKFNNAWNSDSVSDIYGEVQACRAIKAPASHLPIHVAIDGSGPFLGSSPRRIVASLTRNLASSKAFTFAAGSATDLNVLIKFESTFVSVRLAGRHPEYFHVDKLDGLLNQKLEDEIAADIGTMLAFTLGAIGLNSVAMHLILRAVPTSGLILHPQRFGDVVAELAREHEIAHLQTLIRRVFTTGSGEAQDALQLSLNSVSDELSQNERIEIARTLQTSAKNTPHAASRLYNAGNFIRRDDFELARSLYGEAAESDPSYRDRGYWWGEQGEAYFLEGDYRNAQSHYKTAVELGDRTFLPLLADSELRLGRYRVAVELFSEANSDERLSNATWRLSELAFTYLVDQLGIDEQTREPVKAELGWPPARPADYPTAISEALNLDLLFWPALWAATHAELAASRSTLPYRVAAALLQPDFVVLWEEAARDAFNTNPQAFGDIIECVKKFCRNEFIAFIHEDENVSDDARWLFVKVLETFPEPSPPPFTIRSLDGQVLDNT